ncbi:hypothetical protein [Prevotella sp.]|uniref:hypothetical protein n=1 Tax=Prevotella sp. TaxID=59823 RepID=UPI003077B8E3
MNDRAKFILTYVAGIVTGVVLIMAVGFFIAKSRATSASNDDVVMFEQPRDVVPGKVFEVMQVLSDGSALATVDDVESGNLGTVVLFVGDESTSYYDSQKINVPKGKVVKQVGTYGYMTRDDRHKTVPIVEIMEE